MSFDRFTFEEKLFNVADIMDVLSTIMKYERDADVLKQLEALKTVYDVMWQDLFNYFEEGVKEQKIL